MAKRSIGATLVLNAGGFFTNAGKAEKAAQSLKNKLIGTSNSSKTAGKSFTATGSSLGNLAGKIVGIVAAYASVSTIKKFGQECLEAANKATEANVRLETIMKQIPGNTDAMTDSVKKYASELSRTTTIGGSAEKMGASQLASFQMSADSIKQLLPQLNNLAVAQYGIKPSSEQMMQAANMIGKAYAGQTGAMSRAGIVMSDAQAKLIKTGNEATRTATLVEVLKQNFGNLSEEMAKTPQGFLVNVQNRISALKTKIGTQLQPVMTAAIETLSSEIPTIENYVTSLVDKAQPYLQWFATDGIPKIGNVIKDVSDKIGNAIGFVKKHMNIIRPIAIGVLSAFTAYKGAVGALNIFTGITGAISTTGKTIKGVMTAFKGLKTAMTAAKAAGGGLKVAFALLSSPVGIGGVLIAIGALVAIGVVVYKNWDKIKEFGIKCFEAIKNAIAPFVEFFSQKWEAIKNAVTGKLENIKNAYEAHGGGAKGIIFGAMEAIKGYYTLGWSVIDNLTGGKLTAIKDKIVTVFTAVKDKVSEIITGIKDKFKAIWDGIKNIIKTPHIVQKGTLSIAGISTPIPKLGLEWHKNGGIMTKPTAFGMSGNTVHAGGEAGAEAILPLAPFWRKLKEFTKPTNNNSNVFNIYINGNQSADDIVNDLVPKLKLALSNL